MEEEIRALYAFAPSQTQLTRLMKEKEAAEREIGALRLAAQRRKRGYADPGDSSPEPLDERISETRGRLSALDDEVAPLARQSSELVNERWGPLMRAGGDKSLFARQVERYADVYTSQVSNFLAVTPFAFLRQARSSLPHDQVDG
jgi:hypothetical protein